MKIKVLAILLAVIAAVALSCLLASCFGSSPIIITYVNGEGGHYYEEVVDPTSMTLRYTRKPWHDFMGYYTIDGIKMFDSNGELLDGLILDAEYTVYARYDPYEYNLVFDAGEGVFEDGESTREITFSYGENLRDKLPVPTNPDPKYQLDGWFSEDGEKRYSDLNGTEPITLDEFNFPLSGQDGSSVPVKAVYKIKEFTVTLDYNNRDYPEEKLTVLYGEGVGDLSGYGKDTGSEYISGWSSVSYNAAAIPEEIYEDIRIYAVWQEYKAVKLVYKEDWTEEIRVDVAPGTSSQLPIPEPTGYDFHGWYTSELFSGNPVGNIPYGAMQDTYYARITPKRFTVTVVNRGAVADTLSFDYGATTVSPYISPDPGYVFSRWECVEMPEFVFGDPMPAANITVKARWDFISLWYDSGYSEKTVDASYTYDMDYFDISAISMFLNENYFISMNVSVYMWEKDDGYQEIYVANFFGTVVDGEDAYEYGGSKKNSSASWVHFAFGANGEECTTDMHLVFGAHGAGSDDWVRAQVQITVRVHER